MLALPDIMAGLLFQVFCCADLCAKRRDDSVLGGPARVRSSCTYLSAVAAIGVIVGTKHFLLRSD